VIIHAAVDIDAPMHEVFEAALDWGAQERWMPLTRVALVNGDGRSVGSRVVARTGFGRFAAVDPMILEVWEPDQRCEVRHEGRIVQGRGVFRVEPIGDRRSRFIWEELLPEGRLYGWIAKLAAPVNRAFFARAVRRFARWVEAGRP
jgi:uncharacterized protein YndB with AHSA1/START domain